MKKKLKGFTSLLLITLLLCVYLFTFAEDGDPLIKTTKGVPLPPLEPPAIVEPILNIN